MTDLLVLGSGVAGLSAALHARASGQSVLVLTKGELAHSATWFAQGGVAAALGEPDSPELHFRDTVAAGAGLCDAAAVDVLVREGPDRVRELAELGAQFDDADGRWLLAREGGHSLARVVHSGGDATGAEIERALVAATVKSGCEIREGWFALSLLVADGRAAGVVALDPNGRRVEVRATHTVIATGGAGQCYAVTTNPALSTGDGVALALRAGVACADMEFVQFHPTALHHPAMPRPLLSEALRGEGALLRDASGEAFMRAEHPLADLAPRDVVARAIHFRMRDEGSDHVWLDATTIDEFAKRFPTIWQACQAVGLDPTREWLPVAPAAHYLSGGVLADLDGATTLPGLWTCGEAACSGVHGANRLASNSLLDGLVFGARVVAAISRGKHRPDASGAMASVLASGWSIAPHEPVEPEPIDPRQREAIQGTMSSDVGVVRDADGLALAAKALGALLEGAGTPVDRAVASYEVANLAVVAAAIVAGATARIESRGSHFRADFPTPDPMQRGRYVQSGGVSPAFVATGHEDERANEELPA
ncbi:MAG: L-aspartate oxidase [Actinomycetota bacterium]|nr:L-aspartate oxidase [Actinomycetota bacterium]